MNSIVGRVVKCTSYEPYSGTVVAVGYDECLRTFQLLVLTNRNDLVVSAVGNFTVEPTRHQPPHTEI